MRSPVRTTICLGLIAGLLLSPKLWLSDRDYPLTPALDFFPPIPHPLDLALYSAMIALLVLIFIIPRPVECIAGFTVVALTLAIEDQSRWQPWFYQYVFMLVAIGLARPDSAFNICRLILASVYFWSGLQKFNPGFQQDTLYWLLAPLTATLRVDWLAVVIPVTETLIALGLLIGGLRKPAVIAAVAMHLLILLSVGPLGHNHNRVVWPWNLAMGVLVVLLFWHSDFRLRDLAPRTVLHAAVFLLFAVLPALSFFDLWDSYLSFALYSGNQRKAVIYLADAVAAKLPDRLQQELDGPESDSGVDTLDIEAWSFDELNVPDYAEIRVLKNVGRSVCRILNDSPSVVLMVDGRRQWLRRMRRDVYTCDTLSR
ncbi:MAG TPA: DoxX family protein [Bryobacteraceae bacterium]